MSVLIETSIGDIVIDLYTRKSPNAASNFIKLCKVKYYNGCAFYFVQKDYIAITGDQSNKGGGGQSIYGVLGGNKYFDDDADSETLFNCKGLIATSNSAPNKNTSEFFITLTSQNLTYLNKKHTIFGKVVEGISIVDKINNCTCNYRNKPLQQIVIKHTYIIADDFPDPHGLIVPPLSPIRKTEDEEALDPDFVFHKKEKEELDEEAEVHEAKTRAIGLYVLEDIPDAEIKPPENVLFVCKLNPVTKEDDLLSVFNRFGKIVSCQVIRDWKTNDSLQYAFIEFEKKEDCEEAFFKMDNVLMDGRRIHVDFSQSVAKQWAEYKKKSNLNIAQTVIQMEKEGANKKSEKPKIEIKSVNKIDEKYPIIAEDAKLYSLSSSDSSNSSPNSSESKRKDSSESSSSSSSSSRSSCRSCSSSRSKSHHRKRSRSRSFHKRYKK